MTLEKKIVVGLNDIAAIILRCTNQEKRCGARFSASPDIIQIPQQRPQCNATWWEGDQTYRHYDNPRQKTFLELLGKLRDREADGAPFKILFGFEAPEDQKKPRLVPASASAFNRN